MALGKIFSGLRILITPLVALAGSTALAADTSLKSLSLQCTALGMGDVILIRSHYDAALSGRKTFDVFFAAKPGRTFKAGQKLKIMAAGVAVETRKLRPIVGGEVAAEMQFDNAGIFGDHTKPFPPQ